jgi:hypothetical protein
VSCGAVTATLALVNSNRFRPHTPRDTCLP